MKKTDILKDLAASSEKRRKDSSRPAMLPVSQGIQPRRTSVVLTADDLQQTYKIIDIAQNATGLNASTSHAIKIALALIPNDEQAIITEFENILKQDRRRRGVS